MSKVTPLDVAPPLPGGGCVDFNILHERALKGDVNAMAAALIVPPNEAAPEVPATPAPAPSPTDAS
jgi:hypothetical protein